MDLNTTLPIEGAASAQLVRPDVPQVKWLAFPFAAAAWGMNQHIAVRDEGQLMWTLGNMESDSIVLVERSADFDAWRVGGGIAFRW